MTAASSQSDNFPQRDHSRPVDLRRSEVTAENADSSIAFKASEAAAEDGSSKKNLSEGTRNLIARDEDFLTLGVPAHESRLMVIRSAARRSAGALAVSQLRKPSPINEMRLARVLASAYRVLDPRARDDRFEQVQVGRILPNTLLYAAQDAFPPSTDVPQQADTDGRAGDNRRVSDAKSDASETFADSRFSAGRNLLFRDLPAAAGDGGRNIPLSPITDASPGAERPSTAGQISPGIDVTGQRLVSPREAQLVLDELREMSRPSQRWRAWSTRPATLIGLTVAVVVATTALASWNANREQTADVLRAAAIQSQADPPASADEDQNIPLPDEPAESRAASQVIGISDTLESSDDASNRVEVPSQIARSSDGKATNASGSAPNASLRDPARPAKLTEGSDPPSAGARNSVGKQIDPSTLDAAQTQSSRTESSQTESAETEPTGIELAEIEPFETETREAINPDSGPTDTETAAGQLNDAAPARKPGRSKAALSEDPNRSTTNTVSSRRADMNRADKEPGNFQAKQVGKITPTDLEVRRTVEQLWSETPLASDRFTVSRVDRLIAGWERMARRPGTSAVHRLAARQLILEASWLTQPLSSIAAHARILADGDVSSREGQPKLNGNSPWQTAVGEEGNPLGADDLKEHAENRKAVAIGFDGRPSTSKSAVSPWDWPESDAPLGSVAVCDSVAQRLVESWQACRSRVNRTGDLNQLIAAASQLADCLIVNQRAEALQNLVPKGEEAATFASDTDAIDDWHELTEAAGDLKTPEQLRDWTAEDMPPAVLGRTLCLQLRQWEKGLPYLLESSDVVLAKVAETELAFRQGDPGVTTKQLATRWLGVADRLNSSRDAASIRLHVIELLQGATGAEAIRESVLAALPPYVAVPSGE